MSKELELQEQVKGLRDLLNELNERLTQIEEPKPKEGSVVQLYYEPNVWYSVVNAIGDTQGIFKVKYRIKCKEQFLGRQRLNASEYIEGEPYGHHHLYETNIYINAKHPPVKAHPKIIEELLTKAAKQKGFDNAKKIRYHWSRQEFVVSFNEKTIYDPDTNTLFYKGMRVYCSGKWAEIIESKEPPIMIGDCEVAFMTNSIRIDGHVYTKEFITLCGRVLTESEQIKSLNVGCNGQYKVDAELITRILERMK
jgi:hypothetical protein